MEWKKVKIGDCCDITSSKRFHLSERTHTGVPFYCTKEIIQKLRGDKKIDCDYIPEDLYLDIKKKFGVPTKDDLLLTTRGTIGIPYLYKDTDRFYFADGNLSWFRKFNDYLNPNYLYYWFLSPNGRFCVNSIAVGTAQKAVPIAGLMNLPIFLPPLPYQRRISSILSDYDSLIENYQRQISLLEESAKRIYKEWFVDFKFPGVEMAENGLPKGWQKKKLGEICEITFGQSPESQYYNTEQLGLPFHQGVGTYGDRFPYTEVYTKKYNKVAEANSILFSVRAPVGRLNITTEKVAIGRGLAAINHYTNKQSFLYYLLKQSFFRENIIGNGAIFASVNKEELSRFEIIEPSDNAVSFFEEVVGDIDTQIKSLTSQIRLLRQNRDILLPRLMNGEIEIEG